MVGEIRDAETAQIAIQSALTGHLVFSTVHANNAFDVIGRFVNMGIEPHNFVSSLNCIMAQRLVRTICESCKAPHTVSQAQCEQLGFDYELFKDRPVYEGKGCLDCHGLGYRGRHAITEFLPLTDPSGLMLIGGRRLRSGARRLNRGMTDGASSRGEGTTRETTMREVNRMTFWDSRMRPTPRSHPSSPCRHQRVGFRTESGGSAPAVVPQANRETGRGASVAQWLAEGLRNGAASPIWMPSRRSCGR